MKQPSFDEAMSVNLQDRVSQLERELRQKTQQLSRSEERQRILQGEVREKEDRVAILQGEVREKEDRVAILQVEVSDALSGLRDQLTGQNERHVTELQQVRQEAEQNLQQFREEQVQRQQLMARMEAAMALMRGEAVFPQALELWELQREEVHISQTILGTGGWGCVARGTFRGQTVAVKCLHRGILSPQNEGRVRREISIMSQVRHPNLLLLI